MMGSGAAAARLRTRFRGERSLGLEATGNYVLLVGLFVAMVTMFNQVNSRLDIM